MCRERHFQFYFYARPHSPRPQSCFFEVLPLGDKCCSKTRFISRAGRTGRECAAKTFSIVILRSSSSSSASAPFFEALLPGEKCCPQHGPQDNIPLHKGIRVEAVVTRRSAELARHFSSSAVACFSNFLSDGNTTVSSFSSPVPAPLRLRLQSSRVRFVTNDLADCRSFFQ